MKQPSSLPLSLTLVIAVISGCSTPSTMLINQEGQLYRCASSGWGYVGAPMANSINRSCVDDLKKVGYVEIPKVVWGVNLPSSAKLPLKVGAVVRGSPAESSGIVTGDIVRELDGQPVQTLVQVYQLLDTKKPDDLLQVRIERRGELINLVSVLQGR